jgi:hypothetical protein
MIETTENLQNTIFEIDLSFLQSKDYGFNESHPFFIEDDTLFFLDSINNSKKIYEIIIGQNQTYPNSNYQDQGIITNGTISFNSNITIDYSLEIDSIYQNNIEKIKNIKYYQNGEELQNNFSIDNKYLLLDIFNEFQPFYVKYSINSGSNSLKGRYKKLDNFNNFNSSIIYELSSYEEYFIDNFHFGSLDIGECDNNSGKLVKFYENSSTLTFLFNNKIDIIVCNDNDEYNVEFFFDNNNLNFEISFEDKDKLEFEEDYNYVFGVDKTNNLPIISNIENFNESLINYDDFNYQIIVFNTTIDETEVKKNSVLKIIGESPESTNRQVFSKDEIINVQDDYGKVSRMILNVKIWE